MSNILEFPTRTVQGWNSIEGTLRDILSKSADSDNLTEIVIDRMKHAYMEHDFDYQLSFNLPPNVADHVAEQIDGFIKALQQRNNELLLSRLVLEIKLAQAQGY